LLVIPSAKLTLNGDINRLVPAVLALSRFLNSFKENALSAVTFSSSKGVSTRFFPLLVLFSPGGATLAFLQEAKPMKKQA